MTTIKDPHSAFVPGQWLGPVASGTGKPGVAAVTNVRVGERAAKVYPWMMCVKVNMPSLSTSPPVRVTRTNAGNLGEPTFYNDTNRIIHINEIRFLAMPPSNILDSRTMTFNFEFDLARRFGVSIKHSDYDIVRDFLPLYAMATWNNAASPLLDATSPFSLPVEYLSPNSNAFQMKVRCQFPSAATLATQDMNVCLCGRDTNKNPYILARSVVPSVNGTILAFNENTGGGPVKDLLLSDINFNVSDIFDSPGVNFFWGLQNEVQFIPPEGPRWHAPNDWFPVNGIANQGCSLPPDNPLVIEESLGFLEQNWISYKPVTPHILTPRQQLEVTLKCYQDAWYAASSTAPRTYTTPIWVIMLGTQESLA